MDVTLQLRSNRLGVWCLGKMCEVLRCDAETAPQEIHEDLEQDATILLVFLYLSSEFLQHRSTPELLIRRTLWNHLRNGIIYLEFSPAPVVSSHHRADATVFGFGADGTRRR